MARRWPTSNVQINIDIDYIHSSLVYYPCLKIFMVFIQVNQTHHMPQMQTHLGKATLNGVIANPLVLHHELMYIFLKRWNARSKTCCGQSYITMAIVNKNHIYCNQVERGKQNQCKTICKTYSINLMKFEHGYTNKLFHVNFNIVPWRGFCIS